MEKDDEIPSLVEVNAVVVEADIGERIVVGASHFAGSRPPLARGQRARRAEARCHDSKQAHMDRTKLVLFLLVMRTEIHPAQQ